MVINVVLYQSCFLRLLSVLCSVQIYSLAALFSFASLSCPPFTDTKTKSATLLRCWRHHHGTLWLIIQSDGFRPITVKKKKEGAVIKGYFYY